MRVKKRTWKKPRDVYLTFKGIAKPIGNNSMVLLPPEYANCEVLVTVLTKDDEEFEIENGQ